MGWKAIKDAIACKHHVQVREGTICIGSAYVSEIITISADGKITKPYLKERGWQSNPELLAYMDVLRKLEATGELKTLYDQQDVFGPVVDIYTYNRGRVIKKQCEVPEWPNCCTDGEMIYHNTFFLEWKDAKAELLRVTRITITFSFKTGIELLAEGFKKMRFGLGRIFQSLWRYIQARTLNF